MSITSRDPTRWQATEPPLASASEDLPSHRTIGSCDRVGLVASLEPLNLIEGLGRIDRYRTECERHLQSVLSMRSPIAVRTRLSRDEPGC